MNKALAVALVALGSGTFVFSAAIGTNAKEAGAGKALIEFLRTPQAMVVIKAKGMEPVAQ